MAHVPESSPEIRELSTDAQAILHSIWGFRIAATLKFHHIEVEPTPRGRKALEELFGAGILDMVLSSGRCEEFRLSEHGKSLEFRKTKKWMEKHGDFCLTQPKVKVLG